MSSPRTRIRPQPSNRVIRRDLAELLTLAWPVILSRVAIMVMGLVDVVVVGHLSARELGYLGLAWAPTGTVLMTAMGLLTGVQVMAARHIGEGRPEASGGVFRRGAVYAFWIGMASAVILAFGGPRSWATWGSIRCLRPERGHA